MSFVSIIIIILTNRYTPSFFLWQAFSYPARPVIQVTDLEASVIQSYSAMVSQSVGGTGNDLFHFRNQAF